MLDRLIAIILILAALHGQKDIGRLTQVANDIWKVSETVQPFCGPKAREATALALVSIANHESGWVLGVQDCTYKKKDPAISLFALNGPVAFAGYSKKEICNDNKLAARLSLQILMLFKRCGTTLCMMQGYASGNTSIKSIAANELDSTFFRRLISEHIVIVYKNGCLYADEVKITK